MLGTVPALEIVKSELADPTSDRVIEVLILAYERGGPIVRQILDDLVVATTKDVKVLDEIDSEGLEMRINARAVLVMPWFVLVALTIRPGAFRDFYQSPGGLVVVLVGAALSAVGSWWISRLGRAHEEQRVFGAAPASGRCVVTRSRARGRLRLRRGGGRGCGGRRRPADAVAGAAGPAVHGHRPRPPRSRRRRRFAAGADAVPASTVARLFGPPGARRASPASDACSNGARRGARVAPPPGRLRRRDARRVPDPRRVSRSSGSGLPAPRSGRSSCTRRSPPLGLAAVRRRLRRVAAPRSARPRHRGSPGADPARALHREPTARDARPHRRRPGPGDAADRRPRHRRGRRGARGRCSSGCATGSSEPDAFRRAAELTPEPAAARTYKLFAAGAERGVDLADGLRALSEDLRDARREEIRQTATKRRAAMLVPTIAVLAPVMLLFIAAPLPSIVFGSR